MLTLQSCQHICLQQEEKLRIQGCFTDGLLVANEALSQLSYSPWFCVILKKRYRKAQGLAKVTPAPRAGGRSAKAPQDSAPHIGVPPQSGGTRLNTEGVAKVTAASRR